MIVYAILSGALLVMGGCLAVLLWIDVTEEGRVPEVRRHREMCATIATHLRAARGSK